MTTTAWILDSLSILGDASPRRVRWSFSHLAHTLSDLFGLSDRKAIMSGEGRFEMFMASPTCLVIVAPAYASRGGQVGLAVALRALQRLEK